jgi:hypothetical protein
MPKPTYKPTSKKNRTQTASPYARQQTWSDISTQGAKPTSLNAQKKTTYETAKTVPLRTGGAVGIRKANVARAKRRRTTV